MHVHQSDHGKSCNPHSVPLCLRLLACMLANGLGFGRLVVVPAGLQCTLLLMSLAKGSNLSKVTLVLSIQIGQARPYLASINQSIN